MDNGIIKYNWIKSAQETLPDAHDRLYFYERLFAAIFSDQSLTQVKDKRPIADAMLNMILPDIQANALKYEEKCEKNRQNALKRTLPNATERYRTLPNATERYRTLPNAANNNSNSNNKGNNNLSFELAREEERDKFFIYSIFFSRHAADIDAEVETFYNYYDALGWKNASGAVIVNKISAAKMWRIHGDTLPAEDWRINFYKVAKRAQTDDCDLWRLIKKAEISGENIIMYSPLPLARVQELESKFGAILGKFFSLIGVQNGIWRSYKMPPPRA